MDGCPENRIAFLVDNMPLEVITVDAVCTTMASPYHPDY
jgi:hypothetical protein